MCAAWVLPPVTSLREDSVCTYVPLPKLHKILQILDDENLNPLCNKEFPRKIDFMDLTFITL